MTCNIGSRIAPSPLAIPSPVDKAEGAGSGFEFYGRHLVASYMGCQLDSLLDEHKLVETMHQAALAAGATVISCTQHTFPNAGITAILLLAESHASIHTYPEHLTCFLDIFTCGYDCYPEKFDEVMQAFLRPSNVTSKMIRRDQRIEQE